MALTFAIGLSVSAQQPLRFEVGSIKPGPPSLFTGTTAHLPGGERYRATNSSLRVLLMEAYRVNLDSVIGGPDWVKREFYDVEGRAPIHS